MESFLMVLRDWARDPHRRADEALDDALVRLSRILAQLAPALEVEYRGPFVGIGAGREAFCLAVRAHTEDVGTTVWAARVCSAAPHRGLAAHWDLAAVSRLRKPLVAQALPAFLAGYHEAVVAAARAESAAGRRLRALSQALDPNH
ncbi:hypothetical protein [Acidiferrobacter sp.]|uniref:hypothetical protein n=1 Tax=Acidiferrobacter sp. TaxID=1872107 RepID=UPI0026224653|nr:hypothetical protein [Acidiferrobacter sp.]